MGKKAKTGKNRLDKFYHLAKEQGYRSRAAFKLVQLNQKFDFLSSARCLIDLCAAPGGWMQVAQRYMPVSSLIIGVDLAPIKQIGKCVSLVEDITTQKCRTALRREMKTWSADVVLNDGAPNVGSAWVKDAYTQSELVLHACKLAAEFLREGGWFVTKVFRSQDYNSLLWVFKQLFQSVHATKPTASRSVSAEIFVVCKGFLKPKSIDPRMFDPKSVFELVEEKKVVENVFKPAKNHKVRHREGYEDGVSILYKSCPALDFLLAEDAVSMLAMYNEFTFDVPKRMAEKYSEEYMQQVQQIAEANAPDCEARRFCGDLRVLGKREFRALLKWRSDMRRAVLSLDKKSKKAAKSNDGKEPTANVDEDNEVTAKLSALVAEEKKKRLKREKRQKEKQQRISLRAGTKVTDANEYLMSNADGELFAISNSNGANVDEFDSESDVSSEENEQDDTEDDAATTDSDSSYDDRMDTEISALYKEYVQRRNIRMEKARTKAEMDERKRARFSKTLELKQGADSADALDSAESAQVNNESSLVADNLSSKANLWFSQDLFSDLTHGGSAAAASTKAAAKKRPRAVQDSDEEGTDDGNESDSSLGDDTDAEYDSDELEELATRLEQQEDEETTKLDQSEPLPEEMYDSDTRAKTLAIAKKMLRKKQRYEIEDNAYNRYTVGDNPDDLPQWFVDDERRHFHASLPVSRKEVMQEKGRFKDVNIRPMKKVAEAKMRKKRRMLKRMEKLKDKAESIVESSEMKESEKGRAIEKLYKSATPKKKGTKLVVTRNVHGKGSSGAMARARKGGFKTKRVDRRMKADARGEKASDRRQKRRRRN